MLGDFPRLPTLADGRQPSDNSEGGEVQGGEGGAVFGQKEPVGGVRQMRPLVASLKFPITELKLS